MLGTETKNLYIVTGGQWGALSSLLMEMRPISLQTDAFHCINTAGTRTALHLVPQLCGIVLSRRRSSGLWPFLVICILTDTSNKNVLKARAGTRKERWAESTGLLFIPPSPHPRQRLQVNSGAAADVRAPSAHPGLYENMYYTDTGRRHRSFYGKELS